MRLAYLKPIIAIVLIAGSIAITHAADSKGKRPNILFCFADDWGWPHAGVYGDPVVKTPAFDRLAKEGVLFNHAFISSPSCIPSLNAVLTRQQFFRLDAGANLYGALDVKHPIFVKLLEEAGYQTGHWRKAWGPGDYAEGGYNSHPCGNKQTFTQFMNGRDSSEPFCFWFGTSDPHRGYKKGTGRQKGMNIDRVPVPAFYPDVEEVRFMLPYYLVLTLLFLPDRMPELGKYS